MMMLTSTTTTTAAINDITTSSRDDFDRSFDYWSKGDTTGSRGSGAVSPDEEEEEYEYDAEEGDAYQYDGDEQQQQQQQPHDTPTRGGPPVGTGPPASSWLHHIQAAASSLHPTSHGTNRDDGAPPPASVVENDEGDYDYEYDEDEVGEDGPPRLRLAVHEQLSAAYGDDPSAEPSCRLEGCVYAQYSGGTDNLLLRTAQSLSSSLEPPQIRLVLRDPLGQLVRVDPDTRYCNNNATSNGSDDNDTADHRVLLVRVPPDTEPGRLRLASYGCAIRPVPLLVKSRVQASQNHSRAGLKIRANPSNAVSLRDVVILLAVPPSVKGSTARMSRPGGTWNEMKRTLSWTVDKLEPGEALEVQLHFESLDGSPWDREPKFPVLVRADCRGLFSSIDLRVDGAPANTAAATAPHVHPHVSTSARVLHRKV